MESVSTLPKLYQGSWSKCRLKMFWILLRLFDNLHLDLSKNHTVLLIMYASFVEMDPRRARDPRLARADPRLQQQATSSTPPNAPPPPRNTTPSQNHNTPPPPPSQQHSTPSSETPETYKERPLFCVVCANNQVCRTRSFLYIAFSFPPIT